MIAEDSIDIEALEAAAPASADDATLNTAENSLVLDLADLIADDNGSIHIANAEIPVTLTADVGLVDRYSNGDETSPTYGYEFANDLTVFSEAELNIVILTE